MRTALLAIFLAAAAPKPDPFHPAPAALDAVHALNLDPPKRRLNKIVVEGVSFFRGRPAALREEISLLERSPSGLTSVRQATTGDQDFQTRTSVDDIVSLEHKTYLHSPQDRPDLSSAAQSLSFFGDWRRMPVGGRFGYRSSKAYYEVRRDISEVEPYDETCRVVSEEPAKAVFPTLLGLAKRLVCVTEHHGRTDTADGVYLEDYGWFVELSSRPNDFFYFQRRIVAVE